jgi:S1-C subfamily serine protease
MPLLVAAPNCDRLGMDDLSFAQKEPSSLEGVALVDVDKLLRRALRIPPDVQGAVVLQVEPGSAAAESGLRPGDVIQSVNRREVKDADDAADLMKNTSIKRTLLHVWRGGSSHFILVACE